jgi:preprotein translocase subunit YajC
MQEKRHMARTFGKMVALSVSTLVFGASLAFAGGMSGTVTKLDDKGMATVKTTDGKEYQVKAGEGWKTGAKVDCEMKDNKTECHAAK